MDDTQFIYPQWPAPKHIKAGVTTRIGGVSCENFASFNLSPDVGDCAQFVEENRRQLQHLLKLPSPPAWLKQCHGTDIIDITQPQTQLPQADGALTTQPNFVLAVLTADCLPVFLTDSYGDSVAVVHAGWRGLAAGILEKAVRRFADKQGLMAWLGPAIGPQAFQVRDDVYQAFVSQKPEHASAFRPADGNWYADLYQLARQKLARLGVEACFGGDFCTFSDSARFFSYRRDGQSTGRMASLIWKID